MSNVAVLTKTIFCIKGVLSGPRCTILLHILSSSCKFYKLKSDLLDPPIVQKNDDVAFSQ